MSSLVQASAIWTTEKLAERKTPLQAKTPHHHSCCARSCLGVAAIITFILESSPVRIDPPRTESSVLPRPSPPLPLPPAYTKAEAPLLRESRHLRVDLPLPCLALDRTGREADAVWTLVAAVGVGAELRGEKVLLERRVGLGVGHSSRSLDVDGLAAWDHHVLKLLVSSLKGKGQGETYHGAVDHDGVG